MRNLDDSEMATALREKQRATSTIPDDCRWETDLEVKSNERSMKSKRHRSQITTMLPENGSLANLKGMNSEVDVRKT